MGAADVELAANPAPITASAASVMVFMYTSLCAKAHGTTLLKVPLPISNVAQGLSFP